MTNNEHTVYMVTVPEETHVDLLMSRNLLGEMQSVFQPYAAGLILRPGDTLKLMLIPREFAQPGAPAV